MPMRMWMLTLTISSTTPSATNGLRTTSTISARSAPARRTTNHTKKIANSTLNMPVKRCALNSLVALGLVLLIVNVSIHMRIGMHEIIMDYLDETKQNRLAIIANNAFAIVIPAVTILAVAKIVFWG